MKSWLNQLNVQGKLYLLFGFIILVGALTVGANVVAVMLMRSGNENLAQLSQKLDSIYQAEEYIQRIELAEIGYQVSEKSSQLDEFENYNAQLEAFIAQALLAATTVEEKAALYELESIQQEHQQTFLAMVEAIEREDWDTAWAMEDSAQEEIVGMYDQADGLSNRILDTLTQTDQMKTIFEMAAAIISVLVLLFFAGLALAAALMLHNQMNRPLTLLTESVAAVEQRQFAPAKLDILVKRGDEIGQIAQTFVRMAAEVNQREESLLQEAAAIQTRIE